MLQQNLISQTFQGEHTYQELKELCLRYKNDGGVLLIFDDGIEMLNSEVMQTLFVQGSHHLSKLLIIILMLIY